MPTTRRPGASSATGLDRVSSRKLTPIDQQETRVNPPQVGSGPSPWASNEETVKAVLPAKAGPVPASPPDQTERGARLAPRDTSPQRSAGSTAFKIAIVLLLMAAVAVGGLYVWNMMDRKPEVYVLPPNVPVSSAPRFDYDPPRESRRPAEAARKLSACDEQWAALNASEVTVNCYLDAWEADPTPEIALRIGELYQRMGRSDDARNWWARFKRDAPAGSKAVDYVDTVLPAE